MVAHRNTRQARQCRFLTCTEVLEHVLLPRLTARDQCKLSCTSTAMKHWLLGTPTRLWQVSH